MFSKVYVNLGRFSKLFAIISSLWLIGTSLIILLPTEFPITKQNMNYSVVVASIFFVLGYLNWLYNTGASFHGPAGKTKFARLTQTWGTNDENNNNTGMELVKTSSRHLDHSS